MSNKKNISLILNALKKHYNFKSNIEFANFLGIAPTTLSSWYSRNTLDYDLIYAKCKDIDANWLLTGEGPMLKQHTDNNNGPPTQLAAEPKQAYSSCPLCKEKDKVIAAQEKTIALLEDQLRECKQSRAKEGEPAQPILGPELAQLK